jgi:rhamnose transport system substrate-binding protein
MYRRGVLLAVAGAAALALGACGDSSSGGGASSGGSSAKASGGGACKEGGDVKVIMVAKSLNNPYFEVTDKGGKEAAKELPGLQIETAGPTEADAAAQVEVVNGLIPQRPCAIVASANDPNSLVPSLKRASSQGIHTMTFDSSVASGTELFINVATQESIGRDQVKALAEEIGHKGKIGIISGTSTSTNQNEWIDFMKDELSKPAYKDMKLVKIAYGKNSEQTSLSVTEGMLQQYPDLAGIIIPDSVALPIAASVLERRKLVGKVALTGLALPSQMRKYIKNGTVKSVGLWDVQALGYLTAYAAYQVATGKIKGEPGDKFTAGKLGEYTVTEDRQVVLGPLLLFTKENIDKYQF